MLTHLIAAKTKVMTATILYWYRIGCPFPNREILDLRMYHPVLEHYLYSLKEMFINIITRIIIIKDVSTEGHQLVVVEP